MTDRDGTLPKAAGRPLPGTVLFAEQFPDRPAGSLQLPPGYSLEITEVGEGQVAVTLFDPFGEPFETEWGPRSELDRLITLLINDAIDPGGSPA